ncbi:MAG: hypothetical protein JSS97_12530, partial [Actinobacteria bacterium]|nr:hypothetical protein [Actinomycetota bacterium]
VAAVFRPYRSLAPYIQFLGRVMRVVVQNEPDHPDNVGYVVSHVGLNNEERWDEFRELDLEDQRLIHDWLAAEPGEDDPESDNGGTRRFDTISLVDSELVSHFVDRAFLDPEDDRVLDELLSKEVAPGVVLRDLVDKEKLRDQLRQRLAAAQESPAAIPVTPQRRRQAARSRLSQRTGSVVARILKDLGLSRPGRDVAKALGGLPAPNVQRVTVLVNQEINKSLGVPSKSRKKLSANQAETALNSLDEIGDRVRDRLRGKLGGS